MFIMAFGDLGVSPVVAARENLVHPIEVSFLFWCPGC
jgi:hypothetical protein